VACLQAPKLQASRQGVNNIRRGI